MTAGSGPSDREWGELVSDVKHIRKKIDHMAEDYEPRLRRLERQGLTKWIVQVFAIIAAGFGIRTGWGNP